MKRLVLCLLASVALGGCASTNGPASTETDMRPGDDVQQMAAIERAAARSGVQVIWLRPPQKKTPG